MCRLLFCLMEYETDEKYRTHCDVKNAYSIFIDDLQGSDHLRGPRHVLGENIKRNLKAIRCEDAGNQETAQGPLLSFCEHGN